MEDLPLGRIAALVPEFAVKDLPLGRTHEIHIIYIPSIMAKLLTAAGTLRTVGGGAENCSNQDLYCAISWSEYLRL